MIWKATLKWGAFCGADPLNTRTAFRFEASSEKEAKKLANQTMEINPDWILEKLERE